MENEVRFKTLKKSKARKNWNTEIFKKEQHAGTIYASKVNEKVQSQRNDGNLQRTTDERWIILKSSMKMSGEGCIGYMKQIAKSLGSQER